MVKSRIMLGHVISDKGIEVDRAKIEVIAKLPPPTSMKGVSVRSFICVSLIPLQNSLYLY